MSQQKKGKKGGGGTGDVRSSVWPDGRSQMPAPSPVGTSPKLDSPVTPISTSTAQSISFNTLPPLPLPPSPPPRSSYSTREQFASHTRGAFSAHTPKKRKPPLASSSATPGGHDSGRPESDVLGPYHSDGSRSDFGSEENYHGEGPTLVRQASVGKMGRPSLRTIGHKSLQEKTAARTEGQGCPAGISPTSSSYSIFSQRLPAHRDSLGQQPAPTCLDSASPMYARGIYSGRAQSNVDDSWSPTPRVPSPVGRELESRASPISDTRGGRSNVRRPPNLTLDSDGNDLRASQTSLPELIRRATKLASNLERGRTASRVGILDMLNSSRSMSSRKSRLDFRFGEPHVANLSEALNRRSGSITDILASFPSPRITPNSELRSSWPLHSKETGGIFPPAFSRNPTSSPSRQKQRLCGMPIWCFVILCFLVLLLILTAIIVPVVFLVILPRKSTPQSSNTSWGTCQGSMPCLNGGMSIQPGDVCACLCVGGFYGSQCASSGDTSCSTTDINNGTSENQNVTLGSALPRLFNLSTTEFGIPLDQSDILALFSVNGVPCATQNSLVTFNGIRAIRRSLGSHLECPILPPEPTEPSRPAASDGDEPGHGILARETIATANSIVFDPLSLSSTFTPTTIRPTSTASSTSSPSVTRRVLDFSSIAILFIFEQTTTLSAANAAQSQILSFLTNMPANSSSNSGLADVSTLNTTGNFILDFVDFTITVSNGTIVGSVQS
jgi:hypothetical protein